MMIARLVVLIISVGCLCPLAFAQIVETTGPRRERTPDQEAYRQIQIQRQIDARQQRIMMEGERLARTASEKEESIRQLSPEERRRFRELMQPHPDDLSRYAAFLELPRTSIFKMFPNSECTREGVVSVECEEYVPGASSAGLRSKAKTPDIHFIEGRLFGEGFFSQVVLTEMGDVPIERITLGAPAIAHLLDFIPAVTIDTAREQVKEINAGYERNNFRYGRSVAAEVDKTYAARIVAYRNTNNVLSRFGDIGAVLNDDSRGFESLRSDDRADVIVVFRVVRRDPNGALSIVSRELQRTKSPVLNFPKGEKMSDIR